MMSIHSPLELVSSFLLFVFLILAKLIKLLYRYVRKRRLSNYYPKRRLPHNSIPSNPNTKNQPQYNPALLRKLSPQLESRNANEYFKS